MSDTPTPTEETAERGLRTTRVGVVVSDKMDKTAVVEVNRVKKHPKYKKYYKKTKKYKVHDKEGKFKIGDKLSIKETTANYKHLWQIEKAFRISKTDLRVRPIYHYRQRRIEAHICITFVAYTIYKELERLLDKHTVGFSPKRASELTHTMYELEYILPQSRKQEKTILKMDTEQQRLYDIINT